MTRRKLAIFLVVILIVALAACSKEPTIKEINENTNQDVELQKQESGDMETIQEPQGAEVPDDNDESKEEAKIEEETSKEESVKNDDKINANLDGESDKSAEAKGEDKRDENVREDLILTIEGSGVNNPVKFSIDELKAMREFYYEDDYFSLNSYGTKEYFSFKGIKIIGILEKAQVKEEAKYVKFVASDGYTVEIAVEEALREDYIDEENPEKKYPVIIAWHENGKDYDLDKGYPFRLVIGQKEPGDVNKPQWVQNIAKIVIE